MTKYFPIKDLTTWTTRWTICGHVLQKKPIVNFKKADGSSGKVGKIDIIDEQGDSIHATFWGEAAEKWLNYLEQSQLYTFSNGRVDVANKRFATLPHPYELSFDNSAVIVKQESAAPLTDKLILESDHIRVRNYNFTSLREIGKSSRTPPYFIDVIVILQKLAPNTDHFVNRNTQQPGSRRQCVIADDTGYEMQITLFNEFTKVFDGIDLSNSAESTILAMQNVQISSFRGGLNGSTLRSTRIDINPNIPESHRLREWAQEAKKSNEIVTWVSLSDARTSPEGGATNSDTLTKIFTLQEVTDMIPSLPLTTGISSSQDKSTNNTQEIFTVIAEPSEFLYTNRSDEVILYYQACPHCTKKLVQIESSSEFRCEICNINVTNANYRYIFGLHLVDHTRGRFLARTFHDPGQILMGMEAKELAEKIPLKIASNEVSVEMRQRLHYDMLWKKYRLRLRVRREIFAEQERKTVTILNAEPLNYTKYSWLLLKKVKDLLEQEGDVNSEVKRHRVSEPMVK